MRKSYFLFFSLLFLVDLLFGQAKFESSVSKSELFENEKFTISFKFTLNSKIRLNVSDFGKPSFDDFELYGGPFQSSSYSFINGKQSQSIEYKYVLLPKNSGTFTIGKASIKLDDEVLETKPLTITVKKGKTTGSNAVTKSPSEREQSDDVHLVLSLSKDRPYVNEQIIATYQLYFRSNISHPKPQEYPQFTGFWSQEYKLPEKPKIQEITYKGESYYKVVVRKLVLIPQKSGRLIIGPFVYDIPVQVFTGRYDFFGRPTTRQKVIAVSSGSRVVQVKPLPDEGKPDNFSGAVGDFNLIVDIKDETVRVDESIELDIEVVGTGNFKLFELPELSIPEELEVYDPKKESKFRLTSVGLKGKASNNYLIVPRYRGEYKIPPFEFSYFNPKKNLYITKKSDPFSISVFGGTQNTQSDTLFSKQNRKENVRYLDEDIRYIDIQSKLIDISMPEFFGSKRYYLLLSIPLLSILLVLLFGRRLTKKRAVDQSKIRQRVAQKSLSKARKELKTQNPEAFYTEIEKALTEFICAKLRIDISDFTLGNVSKLMKERQVDDLLIQELKETLNDCQFQRYTSSKDTTNMTDMYQRTSKIIVSLDKAIILHPV